MRLLAATLAAILLGACSSPAPRKAAEKKAEAPAPPPVKDNSEKLLTANRVSAEVVQNHLLGISALPGGTIGDYRAKGQKYQLFVIETETPQDAAIMLLDLKNTLKDPEYIASFGGYFGADSNGNLFVFAKGKFLAGVAGLPQAKADAIARELAAKL